MPAPRAMAALFGRLLALVAVVADGAAETTAAAHDSPAPPAAATPAPAPAKAWPAPDGGILLFSSGRSATGSLYDSIVASMRKQGISVYSCRGRKEGWKNKWVLSRSELELCREMAASSGAQLYMTHIKSIHIKPKLMTDIHTPTELINAAAAAGFRLVVVNSRANFLARDVSSFELHKALKMPLSKKWWHPTQMLTRWSHSPRKLEEVMDAAARARLTVVNTTFHGIVTQMCSQVTAVLAKAASAGLRVGSEECKEVTAHTKTSHRQSTLEERIGNREAARVRKALQGSSYAWMLDLSRTEPPNHR